MPIVQKPLLRFRDLALPLLAAALLLFPSLGQTPFRRAEIYFADAARAMVERGDWVIPTFRGEPFFDKPALTYWLQAASFKIFGFSSGSARVPSAIAAVLVLVATAWTSWLLWEDRRSAVAACWILIATVPFMTFGGIAMSDMLLCLWITLAMAISIFCARTERPPSIAVVALGAVLGVGFLTKGPIALLLPGVGIFCIFAQRRRLPRASIPALLLSALVFLVFGLGWFAAVYLRMGIEPIQFFFVRENLQRFSGAAHDVGRPVWFYLVTYLGQGAPWALLVALALRHLWRQSDGAGRILISWMVLVGALLTLSHGKVDYYLLPLYPATALLVGRYLQVAVWTRLERLFVGSLLGLLGLALILFPLLIMRVPREWRPHGLAMFGTAFLLVVAGSACFAAIRRLRPSTALTALVLSVGLASGLVSVVLLPSFYAGQPNAVLMAAASRERQARPNLRVAAHDDPTQLHRDLLFDSRLIVEETDDLQSRAVSTEPYLLLTSPAEGDMLKVSAHVREIGSYPYLPLRFFTLRGIFSEPVPERLELLANFDF